MGNESQKNIYKSTIKLIIIFVVLHLILSIIGIILFFVTARYNISTYHPFAALYREGNPFLYIICSSILHSFIYLLCGLLTAKMIKITNDKKTIITACVICGFLQILSWIFMLTLAFPGNEGIMFAMLLNPFVFWSMNGIININDLRSVLTVLYYLLPTITFFLGIFIYANRRSRAF